LHNACVLGAILDKKFCFDLLENKGQEPIARHSKILSQSGKPYSMEDVLLSINKELKSKNHSAIDSIRSIAYTGGYVFGSIPRYMSAVLGVRNKSCILEFFNPYNQSDMNFRISKYK